VFVLFHRGEADEIIVCSLVEEYQKHRMEVFSMLKTLHKMLNDEKVKETSSSAKFLIKTLKPRA
jgi:hypothetical protein